MMVRARVLNGRLILDEPTDLPDGTVVELTAVDDEPLDLTPEQRAELKARAASTDRGEFVPAADVFARFGETCAFTPDEEQGLVTALESLHDDKGVAHDDARERVLQRTRR